METVSQQDQDLEQLFGVVGSSLGSSAWLEIDQSMVSDFGRVTRDMDRMHVDPDWANENSPYGGPISFGFLTLSLLSHFGHEIIGSRGDVILLNYGLERLRFLEPVPVGQRVRAHMTLRDIQARSADRTLLTIAVEIEIEGGARPALVADWLFMTVEKPLAHK